MTVKTKTGSNLEHALLSPSGSPKWLGCSASLICEKGIPNTSGEAAVLGTAMHTIAETHLNYYMQGVVRELDADDGSFVLNNGKGDIVARTKAPKGAVLITRDMLDQVRKYTDYCKPLIDASAYAKLEMRSELSKLLHPGYIAVDAEGNLAGVVHTFGTADGVFILPRVDGSFLLIVADLKTGRHKVEAKENKQLMLYALGVLRRVRRMYNITAVRLVIFQPYAGGASEWDIAPDALEIFRNFASDRAIAALDVYFAGKKNLKAADFKPSATACQWCRFAEKCNARAKSAVNQLASDDDLGSAESKNVEMTPEELKAAYDKLPELRQHIATVEKAVYSALHKGVRVPGLKLVEGKPGNRSWDHPDNVSDLLADRDRRHIRKLMHKTVLLSPTEAEKVVKPEYPEFWDVLEARITRKPGSPSVAAADDDRPEWKAATDGDLA